MFNVIGKAAVVGMLLCVLAVFMAGGCWVHFTNREVSLRNAIRAQQEVCAAYYDKVWKVLQQKAQVSDQYKAAFQTIYTGLIAGRYSPENGGSLLRLIHEANPAFDTSLFRSLLASIDGEREGFFREQKRLLDLKREHDDLRGRFPSSLVVGGVPEVEIMVIRSERTDRVYETGQENDIDLFPARKP